MRNNLIPLFEETKSAHAGLLMQKGLKAWDNDNEKPIKKALIDKISSVKSNELYHLAFNRWLNISLNHDEFCHLSASVNGRLFTGLALGHALETGAMTHHTYGMPMIAGSSIKGAVKSYAETVLANDENKKPILDILFGKDDDENADAGYLIWHDAWWIPSIEHRKKPFTDEIVTVHHQAYYQGKLADALDIENPIPNQQIAITGSFYFTIQGKKSWAEYALNLLKGALEYHGLGAKGSNGYGYFFIDNMPLKPYLEKIENQKQAEQDKLNQAKAEKEKANLSDNQKLIYDFKTELDKKPTSEWHNKANVTLNIVINGENLWFATLFNKVETWNADDQHYALEQIFTPNKKHLSKKLQDKIKDLVKKLG